MKLTTLHNTTSNIPEREDETLTEGHKFGTKEIKQVMTEARDILVGIEYEMHVNEEFQGESDENIKNSVAYRDDLYDNADELLQEEKDRAELEWKSEHADSEMAEFDIESMTSDIKQARNSAIDMESALSELDSNQDSVQQELDDWDEDDFDDNDNFFKGFDDEDTYNEVKEYHRQMLSIKEYLQELNTHASSAQEYEYGRYDLFSNIDFSRIESSADALLEISKQLPTNLDTAGDIQEFVDATAGDPQDLNFMLDYLYALKGSDSDWDDKIRNKFKDSSQEAWDDYGNESFTNDIEDYMIKAENDMDINDYRDGDGDSPKNTINDILNVTDNKWGVDPMYIREVTTDPSVSGGVEVISNAVPLKKSHEEMRKMFKHIQEVGSTSDKTGMHVNLSIKGLHFSRDKFNAVKMVLLMDDKFLIKQFGLRNTHVSSMFGEVSPASLFGFANAEDTNEMIEKVEDELVNHTKKYQLINFQHTFSDPDMQLKDRRIEFRFFGGENYEDDPDVMEWHINRAAYMMMGAFSPSFAQKEYLKKMIVQLDRLYKEEFNMRFTEFTKRLRKISEKDRDWVKRLLTTDVNERKESAISLLKAHLLTYPSFVNMQNKWLQNRIVKVIFDELTTPEERSKRDRKDIESRKARRTDRLKAKRALADPRLGTNRD